MIVDFSLQTLLLAWNVQPADCTSSLSVNHMLIHTSISHAICIWSRGQMCVLLSASLYEFPVLPGSISTTSLFGYDVTQTGKATAV